MAWKITIFCNKVKISTHDYGFRVKVGCRFGVLRFEYATTNFKVRVLLCDFKVKIWVRDLGFWGLGVQHMVL